MDFSKNEIYIPNNEQPTHACARTTDLCIGAHQDDVELMAFCAIAACHESSERWFGAAVLTDGASSPRSGAYKDTTNDEMVGIRACEQSLAADVGRYSVLYRLSYTSAQLKDSKNKRPVEQLTEILRQCHPDRVYIHNLADKHDSHVAAALRAIEAIRALPAQLRPEKLYGMEVWRSLDWLCDDEKVVFDCSGTDELSDRLLSVYRSQLDGGKAYDKAIKARRTANATFLSFSRTDGASSLAYGMDLSPLINSDESPCAFVSKAMERFSNDVKGRIASLSGE